MKEILEELQKIKEKISKYEKEIEFFREGILKSPGIIGPSASGIEVLLNNTKKGVYSKINLIEGTNITFDFSENKQEGRANLTINLVGGGGGGEGATTFLQLTDTPSSYDTHGSKLVQVNSSENALEFAPISSLLNAGSGISLSGTTNVTITNTGILSLNAGSGISISGGQNPTITNTGVLSLNSATGTLTLQGTTNQVSVNTSGNTITLSLPQNIHTGASPTFNGLTLSSLTPGSVLFAGSGGTISQNNSGLFWDNANRRLGIGTSTPAGILHVVAGTVNALVVSNDARVGIGTTAPEYKLTIQADSGETLIQGLHSGGGAVFTMDALGRTNHGPLILEPKLGDASNYVFVVRSANAANSALLERFRITSMSDVANAIISNANVGIGTTAPTARLHIQGTTGYNQFRLATSYTPTSSNDANGNVGDIYWDNNYIYVKTSVGWKRAALSTF